MKGFEELTLELTDWCPSKCLHCSSKSGPNCKNNLPQKLLLDLIDEAKLLGAQKISLGGGEPTSSENFMPVVLRVTKRNMLLEVFSCGLSVVDNHLESLPVSLLKNLEGLKDIKFIFSIHGATAQTHDYITQTKGSFDCLIDSLKNCLKAGIECEINFVPLKLNVNEFEQLLDLAESLKLEKISVLRFVPQGRGAINHSKLELTSEEEKIFVNELLYLREKKNIKIRTGSPFNGIIQGNEVPCRAGFGKLVIQADGNVLPCEVFKHHERRVWDLSVYHMTLKEIIQSKQVQKLYKYLQNSNCLKCPVHSRDILIAEKTYDLSSTRIHT